MNQIRLRVKGRRYFYLVDTVCLDCRINKLGDEFALEVLNNDGNWKAQCHMKFRHYLEEELLCTNPKCLFASGVEVLHT